MPYNINHIHLRDIVLDNIEKTPGKGNIDFRMFFDNLRINNFKGDIETLEDETKSFAIAVVSDLNVVDDPLNTVKQMIEFSINFAEKFYATLCDQDRTPITKQMISHIESRAQDIARLKQLNISDE